MQRYPYTISAAVSANTYLSLCRLSEEIGEPVSVIVRKMIETGIAEKSERGAASPKETAPKTNSGLPEGGVRGDPNE